MSMDLFDSHTGRAASLGRFSSPTLSPRTAAAASLERKRNRPRQTREQHRGLNQTAQTESEPRQRLSNRVPEQVREHEPNPDRCCFTLEERFQPKFLDSVGAKSVSPQIKTAALTLSADKQTNGGISKNDSNRHGRNLSDFCGVNLGLFGLRLDCLQDSVPQSHDVSFAFPPWEFNEE